MDRNDATIERATACNCSMCLRHRRARKILNKLDETDRAWLYDLIQELEAVEFDYAWIKSNGLITCHRFENGGGV